MLEKSPQQTQIDWDTDLSDIGEAGVKQWLQENYAQRNNTDNPWQVLSAGLQLVDLLKKKSIPFDWDATPANLNETLVDLLPPELRALYED